MKIWNDADFVFYGSEAESGIAISSLMCKDRCLANEACLVFNHYHSETVGQMCQMFSEIKIYPVTDSTDFTNVVGAKCGHESGVETIHDELYPNDQGN